MIEFCGSNMLSYTALGSDTLQFDITQLERHYFETGNKRQQLTLRNTIIKERNTSIRNVQII